jgi:hypothetical protein
VCVMGIQIVVSWLRSKNIWFVVVVVLSFFILFSRSLFDGFFYFLSSVVLSVFPDGYYSDNRVGLISGKFSVLAGLFAVSVLLFVFGRRVIGWFRRCCWYRWGVLTLLSVILLLFPGAVFYFVGIDVLMVDWYYLIVLGFIVSLLFELFFLGVIFRVSLLAGRYRVSFSVIGVIIYEICVIFLVVLVWTTGEFNYIKYIGMVWGADYSYMLNVGIFIPVLIFLVLTALATKRLIVVFAENEGRCLDTVVVCSMLLLMAKPVALLGGMAALPQRSLASSISYTGIYNVEGLVGGHVPRLAHDIFSEKSYRVFDSVPEDLSDISITFGIYSDVQNSDGVVVDVPRFGRIVLLTVESLSLAFTDYDGGPCAQTVTPFIDSLMAEYPSGAIWTNSSPTLYGLTAILSSHPNVEIVIDQAYPNSFVSILSKDGYHTPFVRSASEKYANENVLLKQAGFDEMYGSEYFSNFPDYSSHISGWGLEDRYLYQFAVTYLKEHRDNRVFMQILPADTHGPFGRDDYSGDYPDWPADVTCSIDNKMLLRSFYRQDHDIRRFYKDLVDSGLLNDTLLIITADHSAPRIYSPEPDILERIPVIFISKDRIVELNLNQDNISQLDLAPTILQLAGLESPSGYFGYSLFDSRKRSYLGLHGGFISVRARGQSRKVSMDRPTSEDDANLVRLVQTIVTKSIR